MRSHTSSNDFFDSFLLRASFGKITGGDTVRVGMHGIFVLTFLDESGTGMTVLLGGSEWEDDIREVDEFNFLELEDWAANCKLDRDRLTS